MNDKLIFCLFAGLFGVLLWCILPHHPALPPTASQRARRPDGVTQIDYRALRFQHRDSISQITYPQTTYAQAATLLGEGSLVETSADGRTRTYQWNGGGRWARMEATFRDGGLVSKMQFVLRKY